MNSISTESIAGIVSSAPLPTIVQENLNPWPNIYGKSNDVADAILRCELKIKSGVVHFLGESRVKILRWGRKDTRPKRACNLHLSPQERKVLEEMTDFSFSWERE